jgi:hypothetical protein
LIHGEGVQVDQILNVVYVSDGTKARAKKVTTGEPYAMKVARTVREEEVDILLQRKSF